MNEQMMRQSHDMKELCTKSHKLLWTYVLYFTAIGLKNRCCLAIESEGNLTNRMWCSMVCTLIDNDTRHDSGQNVVDSGGAAE